MSDKYIKAAQARDLLSNQLFIDAWDSTREETVRLLESGASDKRGELVMTLKVLKKVKAKIETYVNDRMIENKFN